MEGVGVLDGDAIATLVQESFDELPAKRKPQVRGVGIKEWVPLSGIVAQGKFGVKCVALATGMKCLPRKQISQANGIVVHDWHAEILAIRSFNRFLLQECYDLTVANQKQSDIIRKRSEDEITDTIFQPFTLRDDVDIHMYCSEAPCGDASMELTMAAQDDASPWAAPQRKEELSLGTCDSQYPALQGRGYFSELGIVRRKPSRPDAPETYSKSCSDKLSQKQCLSLLSSITSLLIVPTQIYIHTLVVPSSQHSATACERAFSEGGRMAPLKSKTWPGDYSFRPFHIKTTDQEFKFSRRSKLGPEDKLVPSNISASWTPHHEETLIGGILQGRKQFDPRGASKVCKKSMWKLAVDTVKLLKIPALESAILVGSYGALKASESLRDRRRVKEDVRAVLTKGSPWVKNDGGEAFGVDE